MLRWFSGGKELAEVFVHKDTGLIQIKKINGVEQEITPYNRIFIPKDKLELVENAAKKGDEGDKEVGGSDEKGIY